MKKYIQLSYVVKVHTPNPTIQNFNDFVFCSRLEYHE